MKTIDVSNAPSIVAWLRAAQYLPEVQHRINIACDTIERLHAALGQIQAYTKDPVAEDLAKEALAGVRS